MKWVSIRSDFFEQEFIQDVLDEPNEMGDFVLFLYFNVLIGGTGMEPPEMLGKLVDEGLAWFEGERFVLRTVDDQGQPLVKILEKPEGNGQ